MKQSASLKTQVSGKSWFLKQRSHLPNLRHRAVPGSDPLRLEQVPLPTLSCAEVILAGHLSQIEPHFARLPFESLSRKIFKIEENILFFTKCLNF